MPTDDLRTYPYLTYDNVLVWRALRALSRLYPESFAALAAEAEKVREAIFEHCTAEGAQGRYFVWSTDLNGSSDVYDEPPGARCFCCPTSDFAKAIAPNTSTRRA